MPFRNIGLNNIMHIIIDLIDKISGAKYARESSPNDKSKLTARWKRNKFNFHESTNANIFPF